MNEPDDEILIWASFKEGDRTSFEKIYHLYFKNLFEYGVRLTNDKELVKDCIHDLFVKLWTNKSNLGDISNVKSYLLVSLRGTIYNKLSRKSIHNSFEIDDNYNFTIDFSAETSIITKENLDDQHNKLIRAMNSLSSRQKEVIYLRYFEEMGYDEVALIMNISVKATYKLNSRAVDALRGILNFPNSSMIILLELLRLRLFH